MVLSLVATWVSVTIAGGAGGADGIDLADINGDRIPDVVSAWEQCDCVKVSVSTGATWDTTVIPGIHNVEDVTWADMDGDGVLDIVSATENKVIRIHWAPIWTSTTVSLNAQRWLQARACDFDGDGDQDIVAGAKRGSTNSAQLGWFEAPAWTFHPIAPAGWTMTVECQDYDSDGDMDVLTSDKEPYVSSSGVTMRERIGSSWYEQTPMGLVWHYAGRAATGSPRFSHFEPGLVMDGSSTDTAPGSMALRYHVSGAWASFLVPMPPGVGGYQDVEPADLNGDGQLDWVVSCHGATGSLVGVFALMGPSLTFVDISGPAGTKFDNVLIADMDGDGKLDVVTSEQEDGLGVLFYKEVL